MDNIYLKLKKLFLWGNNKIIFFLKDFKLLNFCLVNLGLFFFLLIWIKDSLLKSSNKGIYKFFFFKY